MTGIKRLDKVQNSVVLDSVSRSDLIHTFLSRQLRFLGHLLRSDHALYVLYEPIHMARLAADDLALTTSPTYRR